MDDSASLPSGFETDLFTLFLQESRCALSEVNLLPLKTVFFSGFLSLLLRNAAVSNQNCVKPEASVGDGAVRAASESHSEGHWAQSNHEMKRQDSPFCSLIPQRCLVLALLDMMRGRGIRHDKYPSVQHQLKFCYRSISAGFNMSKIHLRTFEAIRGRQGRLFKAFSCVKLLVFLLICYS